jgi:hypothetical protein
VAFGAADERQREGERDARNPQTARATDICDLLAAVFRPVPQQRFHGAAAWCSGRFNIVA